MWKVGTAAKSTVGGWGGAEPGLGGKDNMWVGNILMGRTTRNRRMARLSTRMVTRMTRMRMVMVDRDIDMWVENIWMGRTKRKRLKTRRMMMGDRDNIWAGEDFANMWRAEFHREIDQTGPAPRRRDK